MIQFAPFLIVVFLGWLFTTFTHKMGYGRAAGLLGLVPVVNLGFAIWLVFVAEWPLQAEVNRLRESVAILQAAKAAAAIGGVST